MTDDDYKTMRVPTDAWERAREQKEAAGRTWGEQIVRPENAVYQPGDPNPVDTVEGPDKRLVVHEATAEELARLEELLEKVPARTADEVEDRFK